MQEMNTFGKGWLQKMDTSRRKMDWPADIALASWRQQGEKQAQEHIPRAKIQQLLASVRVVRVVAGSYLTREQI